MEGTTMIAVVSVVFMLTTAATAILRPLVRQLGSYLEALTLQKQQGVAVSSNDDLRRIEASLSAIQEELARVREEREFLAQLYPLAGRSLPESSRGIPADDSQAPAVGPGGPAPAGYVSRGSHLQEEVR
jgi:hypothetical protein